VTVGSLTHPQSRVTDFYRELGELFGIALGAHNRWGGFKSLREKWTNHIEKTLTRPVLLIDEAQDMLATSLAELRALSSANFDSRSILTVVLCGDARLTERFRSTDLLPIGSRIRARLVLDYATPLELKACLQHRLAQAGNPALMSEPLLISLCEHACGNFRTLMNMADTLLTTAAQRELTTLDEKLYLETFAVPDRRQSRTTVTSRTPRS
jgi:general secretion pathway protein A